MPQTARPRSTCKRWESNPKQHDGKHYDIPATSTISGNLANPIPIQESMRKYLLCVDSDEVVAISLEKWTAGSSPPSCRIWSRVQSHGAGCMQVLTKFRTALDTFVRWKCRTWAVPTGREVARNWVRCPNLQHTGHSARRMHKRVP